MKNKIYCRGEEKRKSLVANYHIKPIECGKLINTTLKSCTGDTLDDKYFLFSYEDDAGNIDTFVCGTYAADHFFEMIPYNPPPLFNPLKSDPQKDSSTHLRDKDGHHTEKEWDPLAKELFDAIHLLLLCRNLYLKPKTPLFEVNNRLKADQKKEPRTPDIKTVNTVIKKMKGANKNLSDMYKEQQQKNPNLRSYSFDRINQRLEQENVESFF